MKRQQFLRRHLVCGLFLCGSICYSYASAKESSELVTLAVTQQQTSMLRGIVVDAKGEPVIGASVVEKGTSNGVITDLNGNFSIQIRKGRTLIISYIGYSDQEIKVSTFDTEIKVVMNENAELLDEVVVVGYGVQKKANLTGAVASVKVNDIKDIPVSNTVSLLQGRMSGVTVSSFSAQPGATDDVEIRIRGINTFGNSNPLVP